MKFKLDENLPESLLAALSGLTHDVDKIPSIVSGAQPSSRLFT